MCETSGPLFVLGRVRQEMLAALDARLARDEVLFTMSLTAAQLAIVMMLANAETVRPSHLCERMGCDAGAMTRMLNRLQSKGVIRRRGSPDDRRVVYVELTEKCKAVLPRLREVSREVFNQFLQGFTNAEIRQLEGYLARGLLNLGSCADACLEGSTARTTSQSTRSPKYKGSNG